VRLVEGTQGAEVEDRTEVDVEGVGALTGEDPAATTDLVDRLLGEGGVVGRAALAHVDRRAGQVLGEHSGAAVLDPGHGVELRPVPRGVGDRLDRPGVVEERLLVAHPRPELEAVGDVGTGAALVVDVDLVADVVTELVEVRTAVGLLQRDEVGDQRHRVGSVGTDEGVGVGAVGDRVLGDLGCFAVGGHH
jgi:hypothetical protein